ncbi:glycoside hydrolase superfamily [Russula brevipes]|nr:glycoside hydrolase superfamily [Russula brevipes]
MTERPATSAHALDSGHRRPPERPGPLRFAALYVASTVRGCGGAVALDSGYRPSRRHEPGTVMINVVFSEPGDIARILAPSPGHSWRRDGLLPRRSPLKTGVGPQSGPLIKTSGFGARARSALGRCGGNIAPINDFPGLCKGLLLEDPPLGVRFADFAIAFPAGINAASIRVLTSLSADCPPRLVGDRWKRSLLRARGVAMGKERVGKGVDIALGPMMSIGCVAQGGRNWEGFGADPFLVSVAAYETDHPRVMAGVASIICSYNLVNGTYACENNNTLNGILKKNELGFQGFVMSDWSAQHSTISAMTGLDMTMPGDITFDSGTSYFGANLTAYVRNGTIPEARVDDMATRILASCRRSNEHIDVQGNHGKLVREIDTASIVLLKNVNNSLPLRKPRKLTLIGSDAGPAHIAGPNEFSDQGGVDGVLAMGWGSGVAWFTYKISPYEAFQARARVDHTSFSWYFDDFNLDGAAKLRWNRMLRLRQVCKSHSSLEGTETGNVLLDVMYGVVNPSGRLPYTIANFLRDYSAQLVEGGNGEEILNITYSEGLFVDYRHFDEANIKPRFEFGFGLSYTQFQYSGLVIAPVNSGQAQDQDQLLETNWLAAKPGPQAVGASTALWLHRPAYSVSFTVQNTGSVAGTEIAQLYLHFPEHAGELPSVLRGFTDVDLQPGESKTVGITLSRYDLSTWDVPSQSWMRAEGAYSLSMGASSRDFRLEGTLPL